MARSRTHIFVLVALGALMLATLCACGSGGGGGAKGEASGAPFSTPANINDSIMDKGAATQGPSCGIDTSHVDDGYVGAWGTSSSRLKLQVINGDKSYNYDVPSDGSPMFAPINMGDGSYKFRIMQNTSGSNYVEIVSTSANVKLKDEFQPFIHPNLFCSFNDSSASTKLARELTANASTEGEALMAICSYIQENISYDKAKAEQLANATGYIPNPDQTLEAKSGICFDYASLGAAMLRSIGLPCKIITGYVSPNDLYHAWIMVYVDGTWKTAEFKVNPNEWSRVDLTFAASSSGNKFVGDGKGYTDRYVY